MTKISAIRGISTQKPTPRNTPHKSKKHRVWVDVDDQDDLEVKSARRSTSVQSKGSRSSDYGSHNGPRKKPRLSAPPAFSGQDSLQQQRQKLPIYAGIGFSLSLYNFQVANTPHFIRQSRSHRRDPRERCHSPHWRDWVRENHPYVFTVRIFVGPAPVLLTVSKRSLSISLKPVLQTTVSSPLLNPARWLRHRLLPESPKNSKPPLVRE